MIRYIETVVHRRETGHLCVSVQSAAKKAETAAENHFRRADPNPLKKCIFDFS